VISQKLRKQSTFDSDISLLLNRKKILQSNSKFELCCLLQVSKECFFFIVCIIFPMEASLQFQRAARAFYFSHGNYIFFCTSLMKKDSVSRLRRRIPTPLLSGERLEDQKQNSSCRNFLLSSTLLARGRTAKKATLQLSTTHSSIALNQLGKMSPRERRCVCFNKFPSAQLWPGRKETSALLHSIFLWTYLRPAAHPPIRLATPRGDNLCMKYTAEPLY
jgi:hypothetical protein